MRQPQDSSFPSDGNPGRVLFASRFDAGVPFAIVDAGTDRPVDVIGISTAPYDGICTSSTADTTVLDLPQGQIAVAVRPGSLFVYPKHMPIRRIRTTRPVKWTGLFVELDRLRNAASFGEQRACDQAMITGAFDAQVARLLQIILRERELGYPSGILLAEAACLSIAARCAALGGVSADNTRPVPKFSRQERSLVREMLRSRPNALAIGPMAEELARPPIDVAKQFNATFEKALHEHLLSMPADTVANLGCTRLHLSSPVPQKIECDERFIWAGPAVEGPAMWNACRDANIGRKTSAIVYWLRDARAVLWSKRGCIEYDSKEGSIDLLPSDTTFDEESMSRLFDSAFVIPLEAARLSLIGAGHYLAEPMLQLPDRHLSEIVELLTSQWSADRFPGTLAIKRVADVLLGLVGRWLHIDPSHSTGPCLSDDEREAIWLHVLAHLEEGVSAADLLALTPYSRQQFVACFNASFGTTVHQFLLDRMVDASRYLVRRTQQPLTDIAMELGFASPSHFATTFVARVGCTPSAYRGAGDIDAAGTALGDNAVSASTNNRRYG